MVGSGASSAHDGRKMGRIGWVVVATFAGTGATVAATVGTIGPKITRSAATNDAGAATTAAAAISAIMIGVFTVCPFWTGDVHPWRRHRRASVSRCGDQPVDARPKINVDRLLADRSGLFYAMTHRAAPAFPYG